MFWGGGHSPPPQNDHATGKFALIGALLPVGPAARPGARAAGADVARIVPLVRFAERCEDGWRQWFAATGIQPCEVVNEYLSRDRLGVTNGLLEFLRLPQLGAGDLPPVRYRQQADSLTERYVDLVAQL